MTRKRSGLTRAVYAGSFDPVTNGHLDIVHRALGMFDEVIIAVAATSSDPKKSQTLFSDAERVEMIREALGDTGGRARADSFSGLLVDYCEQVGAQVSIRGLRAVSDFEYEFQMVGMNSRLNPDIQTVFLMASENVHFISSRFVKEIGALGGDVSKFVSARTAMRLKRRFVEVGRRAANAD